MEEIQTIGPPQAPLRLPAVSILLQGSAIILAAELVRSPSMQGSIPAGPGMRCPVLRDTALNLGTLGIGYEARDQLQLINKGQDLLHYLIILQDPFEELCWAGMFPYGTFSKQVAVISHEVHNLMTSAGS